jgi:hypothetical protein
MNLENIFDEVSKQMQSNFEKSRQALQHSGLKGSANEKIVREFLRNYLPRHLDVSSGTAVDSHGGISKQLDIIIHDASRTPIFYSDESSRVVLVECVYAAVEVKACLDKSEIQNAFENMQSIKRLKKEAYFEPKSDIERVMYLYGTKWPLRRFKWVRDEGSGGLDGQL